MEVREMNERTLANQAADARLMQRQMKRKADRQGGYYKSREAQLVFTDAKGERAPCDPSFVTPSRLTGAWLRREIGYAKEHYPEVVGAALELGLDRFDSFRDYMDGCDYEPWAEIEELEIDPALFAAVQA